ncbi:MAG: nucleotidyltransferase domain-containing protein [Candidatus Thorarchaeota archaeon]|nr:nucleotidyltransferase domain-containing protein [Candidatus Thorarchaeota archaeon]
MVKLDKIREDLRFLAGREVVLFGSYVSGDAGPRSDIDVAIITRSKDRDEMLNTRVEASGQAPEGYDIQVFEALPLVVKGAILEQFEVLFGDKLEIGMYFYHIRKVWEDFRHRIEVPTLEEIRRGAAPS